MKKFLSLLLSIVIVITIGVGVDFSAQAAVWNGKAATSFAGGKGTKDSPYLISNAAQLARMRNLVNSTDYKYDSYNQAYYKLTANIALNDVSNYTKWSSTAPSNAWTPIGFVSGESFNGVFDGAGYTISGLYVKKNSDDVGLFSKASSGSTIKNLTVTKSYVSGYSYVGAIVGYVYGTSSSLSYVTNCSVSATTVVGRNHGDYRSYEVGGIVGSANSNVYISKCKSSASVSAYSSVGGIMGEMYIYGKGGVYSCSNSGSVKATSHRVGGICGQIHIGEASSANVSSNHNSGAISAASYAGGIFGGLSDNKTALTMSNCYNTGSVTITDYEAGGICGYINSSNCNFTLSLCYNKADISGSSSVGGLVGNLDSSNSGTLKVSNCSNDASNVNGDYNIGGIAGYIESSGGNVQINTTFNKAYIKASSYSAGGVAGRASNYDYEHSAKITIKNNVTTNSISTCNERGTILGYIYQSSNKNLTTDISNNRYLYSAGNIIGYTLNNGGAINNTGNSSTSSSNIKSESYLYNYGFYICMWSFSDSAYPTVNLSGKHNYVKTSVTKATTSKNGKIAYKCSECGQSKSTVVYYPKKVTLSTTTYTYNGKVKKPTVKVVGSDGKTIAANNYTVTYSSGRKNVGKYTVKVTFKGNYSGAVSKTFTIKPKGTSLSSVTSKSKGFTVKWKKYATQTTGYQLQYSTDSKFKKNNKTVTITKNSTTSKAIAKLSVKKKYYVRIRTYKTVNGTKYYSTWSGSKAVTTKK
ncbi:MAG: hypothetical protein NC397_08455 [Clostridium sp.]|nr:hypothetical protein [Clostridium sp.]